MPPSAADTDSTEPLLPSSPPAVAKLPARHLVGVFLSSTCNGIQITLPFTIAVYIVRGFGIDDEVQVGRLTGLLASLYCLGQFCTSMLWGRISDHVGRKVVVVVGNLSNTFCSLLFGLTNCYWQACAVRISSGLMNGVTGALKTMAGESSSVSGQAGVLLYSSMGWGMGCSLGPSIGGIFSNPCDTYGSGFPLCQPGELLLRKPYFLPCLVASIINGATTLVTVFGLSETLRARGRAGIRQAMQEDEDNVTPRAATDDAEAQPQLPSIGEGRNKEVGEEVAWWKAPSVRLTTMGYASIAFLYTMWDEVNPIYASSPVASGGLALRTNELGVPLTCGGISLFLFAMLAYKPIQRRLGVKPLTRWALRLSVPIALLVPAVSALPPYKLLVLVALSVIFLLRSVLGTSVFTSSAIMVNISAPPGQLGAVNGFGSSIVALLRGVGPGLGGWLWSATLAIGVPYHQYISYAVVAVGLLGTSYYYTDILSLPGLES